MSRHALTIAALALMLAGCSRTEEAPDPSVTQAAKATGEGGPGTSQPVATQAPAPAVATSIPAQLRGRWGLVPADCTSTMGDAKGLLEISADQLKFYESVAELKAVKAASTSAVTADFAFTGEGQSWDLQVSLASPDGGATMVRKDTGPDAMPQPLTYAKCP